MTDRISRRTALAALTVPSLALAQAPHPPASPDQKLEKGYADIKNSSNRLSQISVPMNLEPATTFHV